MGIQIFHRLKLAHRLKQARGRIFLLLPLAVLLAASGYLIAHVPTNTFKGNRGKWISNNQSHAVFVDDVSKNDPDRTDVEVTTIDLRSGASTSINIPKGDMLGTRVDKDWKLYILQRPVDETTGKIKPNAQRMVIIDCSQGTLEKIEKLNLPSPGYSGVVGKQYWLNVSKDKVDIVDLHDTKNEFASIPITGSKYVLPIKGTKRFLLVDIPTGTTGPLFGSKIELYKIDKQASALINSWPAPVVNQWVDSDANNEHIFSVNPDSKRIDVRSVADGKLLSNVSVPGVDDLAKTNASLYDQTMSFELAEEGHKTFDLITQKWLPTPDKDYQLYELSPNRRSLFYCDREINDTRTWKLYDRDAEASFGEFVTPRGGQLYRWDDERVVAISDRFGHSVQFFDLATGKLLDEFKPMAWIVYSIAGLLALFVLWAIAWMFVSAREGGWAWIDLLIVVGLPAAVMIIRTTLIANRFDLSRRPTQLALGLMMALLILASTWIVFGKTRISLRVTPLIVLTSLFMVLLTIVFGTQPWLIWHGTRCALGPALCLMVLTGLLRLSGWKLMQNKAESSQRSEDQNFGPSRFPLRDLILATVVAAIFFAGIRPSLEAIGELTNFTTKWFLPLGVAVVCSLAAILLALHSNRFVFQTGVILAIAGVVFIGLKPVTAFATGRLAWISIDPQEIHLSILCGVAVFVGLIPYRLRNWTLARSVSEKNHCVAP